MPVERFSLMPSLCLSLTNTRQNTHQLVTHHGSASVCSNEQKGVLIAGVTELNNVCACAETGEVWDLN